MEAHLPERLLVPGDKLVQPDQTAEIEPLDDQRVRVGEDAVSCRQRAHEPAPLVHRLAVQPKGHRDRATSWASEVETWRAVAAWWWRERLPDIEAVEHLAAECLANRPEARRFKPGKLARALRAPVGSKIAETPQVRVMLRKGYG